MALSGTTRNALARVVKELESCILRANRRGETRLPSERELAAQFGTSRATIREAIQRLAARGVLETRRGSGLFISAQQPARLSAPWLQLLAENPPVREDTLEFRLMFECAAARFAAQRATPEELADLESILARMHQAVHRHDVEAEAQADAEFHAALAVASHNAMLSHFYASVITLLREHITNNTYEASRMQAEANDLALRRLEQHTAILRAIRTHRPDAASRAMHAHIAFVGNQFTQG
ncbi:FadR/GntR family transcriptional regulator [Trinickia sp.]|uniref:FadR/GntR family transcriptional regulator n=1 Tax=Trinickia sp. TaxID=2571163 RepID=UPI003F7DB0AC